MRVDMLMGLLCACDSLRSGAEPHAGADSLAHGEPHEPADSLAHA